jgi:secreted trypsin-like serine protease
VNEKVCSDPHLDVGVEEMIIHEKYLPQSYNQHMDIALLRLTQKIIFNEFIKPICIQSSTSENLVGQLVTVAGFGKTESALSSNFKLKVSLDIVENEKCNQVFRAEGRRLFEGQLCAGGKKGIDSCRGDSGGEL